MGVRAGVFLCVTSFLLGTSPPSLSERSLILTTNTGALFTHWIADSLTLWKSPVTDEHLWTAASYYSIIAKGPVEGLYFLAAVVVLGATTILWSLNDLRAGNIMFDGGSICQYPFHTPFRVSPPCLGLTKLSTSSPLWHDRRYVSQFRPSE